MASRFPPSSGFNSRDRSPQRLGDRRQPGGPRGLDDGSPSFGREPPRGPRALVDSPGRGGSFGASDRFGGGGGGGRGRGYGRGGDFRDRDRDRDRDLRDPRDRDRDFRDTRDGPPFRRDVDRDYGGRRDREFDPRPDRIGFGRGRSRSPTRDFRDLRDPSGRDFDLVRMRRNSRDSILSASSGGPDGPPSSGGHPHGGGSMRGRGRGDWEGGRGRGRDPFRRRSRSRDGRLGWPGRGRPSILDRDRERDLIDRDRPVDRERERERVLDRERDRDTVRERERDRDMDRRDRFERRDEWEVRRPDREDRDRPLEPWKRDRPPSRTDNRGSIASTVASTSTPTAVTGPTVPDRLPEHEPTEPVPRKASIIPGPPTTELRRDSDRPEPAPVRFEPPKDAGLLGQQSPPPSAPQVPAFGSVSAPIPAVPPAKPPSVEDRTKPEPPPPVEKDRQPFQPPTGPRAERSQSLQPVESRVHSFDGNHRQEEAARAARASTHLSDRSPPTAPAAMAKRDSISANVELYAPGKPNVVTTSPTFTRLPPPAPRALSRDPSISPRMQPSSIPTGPRAYQRRPSSSPRGGGNKGIKAWGRSSFGRTPSVPSAPKKESDEHEGKFSADDKLHQHVLLEASPAAEEPKIIKDASPEAVKTTPPRRASMELPIRTSPQPVSFAEASPVREKEEVVQEDTTGIQNGVRASDDREADEETAEGPDAEMEVDEEEEEEKVVFTKEYLEERKQTFEKEMQSLRSEMPLSPLEDPNIVSLLLRIQMLGKIAQEEPVEQPTAPIPSVEEAEEPSTVPTEEKVVSFAPTVLDRDSESVPLTVVPPIATREQITVESLPFLHSGPPTPISDLEVCHENNSTQERLKDMIQSELIRRQKEVAKKNAILREEYMSYYKRWRLDVWELDRLKEKKPMTPGPASPPAPPIPTPPVAVPEGREGRRYKGNSELDFLNALKASEISAQEELERRRTKMATARPDLAREAVIPDMLEPRQVKAGIYKDVNNTIEASHAMEVFGFLPPPNDFTPEEHQLFTDAFMAYPKKWGKIAESLPGRDFKQCIIHYYLTKEEIKYKAKLNKRWSRRGRGKARSSRPKSNALIADLGVVKPDFDGEDEQPPPVTDTGRPRRAAAPTFGDSNETEGSTPSGRRGQSAKDGELSEKPIARRGGRTAGARTQRRGAKSAQPDSKAQTPVPPSNPPLAAAPKVELGMDGMIEAAPVPQEKEVVEKEAPPPVSRPRAGRGRAKEGVYIFESTETDPALVTPKASESGYGSLQPTSYWSVPEQRDFPRLLAHFGRDFEGISNFMKTKTTVMVKNYFQRRLDSGQKDFEETVVMAEEKKARGEPTGPLPVPSVAPKRRYEATPSAIVPRPLAPHGELMPETEDGRFPSKGKPIAMSPQPMPLHGRPMSENERTPSRYAPLAQASTSATAPSVAATLGEDPSRAMRTQAPPSRMPGPRLGFFTDERRDSTIMPATGQRAQEMQMPSRHSAGASMPQDLGRMDPLSSPAYMPGQPPSSLLPPSHSRHTSLTQAPGSPSQLSRPELDIASVHRDPFAQRAYYSLPGQSGISHSPRPGLSPVKDAPRPSATPVPESTPRQVPAKRSNIMSILNDEPEEPQPRKRFASEVPSGPGPMSASRSVYQPGESARLEDTGMPGSGQKSSGYGQPSPYQTPGRGYPDYGNYGPPQGGSAGSANNDWMARFDPRAQQGGPPAQVQPPPPPQSSQNGRSVSSLAAQGSYGHYASTQPQHGGPLNAMPVPSPAPTPPPAGSQRSAYPSVFSQPGAREMVSQTSGYRPSSPPPRASTVAYGSRPEPPTPAQSSNNLFGMAPRQPGSQPSYSSAAPSSAATTQQHGQSYHQHVQTLVNGAHQPHRSTPVGLAGGTPQYGHNTPPPQAQGRSMPSLANLGRSYTPPLAMHPGGMGYAQPPPSASGGMPPLHQRPPGPGEPPSHTPGHHRVYSQGSVQGGLPGSLHPPSQPPR
ncbi:hypothetical protein PMG11_08455 [Penicillium brasilianum]|uniref:SANT domain-containing protein n=1 Tax=Penicillium brasilianum TaxID=104259 RepID=A0A0F7TST1_PENBI|nr:hypothetical protein PMG11_08455 [Penicillium brasilianum]